MIVNYRLYNPANSIFGSKKDKATLSVVYCSNKECEVLGKGKCTQYRTFGSKCPYAKVTSSYGYTQRAGKFYDWMQAAESKVKGVESLDTWEKIAKIGDYIFFPYPFWSLDSSVKIKEEDRGGFFSSGEEFFNTKEFTVDLFQQIITARPKAMMGGEITDYQKKTVPEIILHMREEMPSFFSKWAKEFPDTASKFETINHVGRMAYLATVVPGSVFNTRDGSAIWDGKSLTVKDCDISLPIVHCSSRVEVKYIPTDKTEIKIEKNSQVSSETIFSN